MESTSNKRGIHIADSPRKTGEYWEEKELDLENSRMHGVTGSISFSLESEVVDSVDDLFVLENLVTDLEQSLGLDSGHHEQFVDWARDVDQYFGAREEAIDLVDVYRSGDTYVKDAWSEVDMTHEELMGVTKEMEDEGFLDYSDAMPELTDKGEFAYRIFDELDYL